MPVRPSNGLTAAPWYDRANWPILSAEERIVSKRPYYPHWQKHKDAYVVPVADLLARLVGGADLYGAKADTMWEHIVRQKTDPNLWNVVDYIIDNGMELLTPIVVHETGGNWRLGNGHHRMLAAVLTGLETIPVVFDDRTFGPVWLQDMSREYDSARYGIPYAERKKVLDPVFNDMIREEWAGL